MFRRYAIFALAPLVCAGLHAATISTTWSVNNASGSIGAQITVSGPTSLTNIGTGTFSASVSIGTSQNISAPYTVTLTNGDKITGTLTVPASALAGGPLTGSATVTGGTGAYAGATGSFPNLTGSASFSATGFTLTFSGAGTITTSGGGGGPIGNAPIISDVLDAGSYTKNIAEGSIFVVKGSNISASGFTQTSFPLPTTTGNVKITFTPAAGGAGTDAYIVYLYNQGGVNQLAAVLPSTVAPGNYNVTVTYNGNTSGPFQTQVVQRKLGLITADSTGSGLAVIQNFVSQSQLDIDRLTTFSSGGFTFSPAKPGQVLIAWAVGLGPVTGGDNVASPGGDMSKSINVQAVVGGRNIPVLYAGRAPGLAGADQINFQLPADVQTGCTVPFQVSVNNQLSNPTYIAIAPDTNSTECVLPGFTSAQLKSFDAGGSYTIGSVALTQIAVSVPSFGNVKQDTASANFIKFTGLQLAGVGQYTFSSNTQGACTVTHTTTSNGATSGGSGIGLDAGNITLNGPSASGLSNVLFKQDANNSYSIAIGTEGVSIPGQTNLGTIVAGTYTVTGAGGKDVKNFSTSITLGSPLEITGGLPSNIVRGNGLTLNWTGGNASDPVQIFGSSSTSSGTGANTVTDTWSFFCNTTAGQKTFTVPSSVLTQLPATTGNNQGFIAVSSSPAPSTFTAGLTAGGSIDQGTFLALIGSGALATYQ